MEEIEDEMQYRLLNQFGELEEMIDNVKEEMEKSTSKLKSQVEKLNKEIQSKVVSASNESLKQSLKSAVEGLENANAETRKLKRRLEKVEFNVASKIKKDIRELESKFDDFEQCQNDKNIQIVGLPESDEENNDKDKIVKIARDKFGMHLKITDIEETYRMGRKSDNRVKGRDLIVKFKKKTTRNEFYENRKKTMSNEDQNQNIYVNDHLTKHRQHLLYISRKLYKAKKVQAAWSQGGNILIRKIENGPVVQIHSHDDLAEIQQEEREEEHTDTDPDSNSDTE